jgi:Mrp family chromosome partitioning ATPase
MSKNFELLQQVGNGEEVFQTAAQPSDAVAAVDAETSPVLDKETLEKIFEKASLPDVFQIASETERETLTKRSKLGPHLNPESASRDLQSEPSADAFRASRSQTGPIGELGKHSANRVTQSPAKSASVPRTLHRGTKPKAIPGTAIPAPPPKLKGKNEQEVFEKLFLSLPWLDSIRSAAKGWARNVGERNNHYGEDLEAITRGEEIKLVQRVFPGTDESSPRTVLFAKLDGEAGCAPTCARVAEMLAARAEGPVCVVDANFRAPSLHEYFGVENVNGLAEATVESGPIQNFAQQIPEPDLWLMPSGKAAAQLCFPTMADGLRVRMEELRNTFRYVVIHSGPLRLETSAMLLSRWTDGVVLVLEANATRRDAARRVKEILDAANVSVLGVVLNNRTFPIPDVLYRRL